MPFEDVFPPGFETDWTMDNVINFLIALTIPWKRKKEVLIEICKVRGLRLTKEMVERLRG